MSRPAWNSQRASTPRRTGRLIQLRPSDYPHICRLNAIANVNLRNLEAVETSVREGQRLDPQHKFPATWHVLGIILARRGDVAGAVSQIRDFLRFLPADPDNGVTRRILAELERRAGPLPPPAAPTFRSESNLVLVRFQVSPAKGTLIGDLRTEDADILEDGIPKKIALFEGGRFYPRTVSLEIALPFDCSGNVQEAGTLYPHAFHQSLLDEYVNARIAIYAFSDKLARLTGSTCGPAALMKAMDGVSVFPSGGTPLSGSIAETARDIAGAGANEVRMLVIFSDGESTVLGDDRRDKEAIEAARDCGIALYPVTLSGSLANGAPVKSFAPPHPMGGAYSSWPVRNAESIHKFERLAEATGGMGFQAVSNANVLPAILKQMARHLQHDYIAGFCPASSGRATRHKVEVVLRSKDRGHVLGGTRAAVTDLANLTATGDADLTGIHGRNGMTMLRCRWSDHPVHAEGATVQCACEPKGGPEATARSVRLFTGPGAEPGAAGPETALRGQASWRQLVQFAAWQFRNWLRTRCGVAGPAVSPTE